MAASKTFCANDRFAIAFWNNVVLLDVRGEIDVPGVTRFRAAYSELASQYPNGIVTFTVLERTAPVIAGEARAESLRIIKEFESKIVHNSIFIDAQGVLSLMMRVTIRGFSGVLRNMRISVHERLDDAAAKTVPFVSADAAPRQLTDELIEAASQVRTTMQPSRVANL